MRGLIDRSLLEQATDQELELYVTYLADEADAQDLEGGAWVLQPRQQIAEDALKGLDSSMSQELLYGGTAGPGKTEFLLWHAYHQCLQYPGLRVLVLRRTFAELRRSIVIRSLERFDRDECRYVITENTWKFKNGSSIELGYCVGPQTPILMGDGSYKRMLDVRVGDMVGTLEGPRRVTKHWKVGRRPAVEITPFDGEPVIASETHELLSASGEWVSPRACASMTFAELAGERSGRTARFESSRGAPLPRQWSVLLGLHGPAHRSRGMQARGSDPLCASERAPRASAVRGLPVRCSTGGRRGGVLLRAVRAVVRACTPSRADVGRSSRPSSYAGDPARTPAHSPSATAWYSHPYTREDRPLVVDVSVASATIALVGERDLWDMTVDGANHYVSRGGMVHKNCETDKDVYQYQSAEYDIVAWDELTQWPSAFCYLYLFSRVRSRISMLARGFVPHVIAGTNPGFVGGAWVKARFVDAGPPEVRTVHELEVEGEFGARIFIPGKLEDNKYINRRQYVAGLANLPKAQREALLDGSWDAIEGQYFQEWDRRMHVCEPFEVPAWWTRIRCIDYGHFAPWCCLWIAFDEDGAAVVYREGYETQLTPRLQCEWILSHQMPGEKVQYTVIDPSVFAKTGAGIPIGQQYNEFGVPVRRALNARVDGWARLRDYMRIVPTPPPHPGEPPGAKSMLRIFSNCTNLIRTLPMLVHDDTNPEDLDTDGEDHAPDALRYGLMSRPPLAHRPASDKPNTVEGRMAQHRKDRELERSGRKAIDHPFLGTI